MYKLVVRLNGTDAAFLPVFRGRARLPRVCTSVSVFVFRDGERLHHTLLDIGPGVGEAIQDPDLFPTALPIDWLILSHSHEDHFLGLDSLCGDLRRRARWQSLPEARLNLHCITATFDETVRSFFPHLLGMIDHVAAEPGQPFVLWRDETAELSVTLLEVVHYRQSAVTVFTFAADGRTTNVVCLFDFRAFHPATSPQALAGGRADNPLFQRPGLLIAESTNWAEAAVRTGNHLAFETLAGHILDWRPLQTRVVHYSGGADLLHRAAQTEFQRHVADGCHLHPREGPVAEWELTAAIQEHLHGRGFPRPRSVSAGRQGETLVVYPSVESSLDVS